MSQSKVTDANNDWEDGCRWWISAHQQISTPSSSSMLVTPPPCSEIWCRRIWLLHLAGLSVAGVKTERRSGGRARGAAAQAHRDGVHVELVAGMSFFRSPAPSTPSPRPGLRRGGEAAEMAVGKPAGAVVAHGGHCARSGLLLPRRQDIIQGSKKVPS